MQASNVAPPHSSTDQKPALSIFSQTGSMSSMRTRVASRDWAESRRTNSVMARGFFMLPRVPSICSHGGGDGGDQLRPASLDAGRRKGVRVRGGRAHGERKAGHSLDGQDQQSKKDEHHAHPRQHEPDTFAKYPRQDGQPPSKRSVSGRKLHMLAQEHGSGRPDRLGRAGRSQRRAPCSRRTLCLKSCGVVLSGQQLHVSGALPCSRSIAGADSHTRRRLLQDRGEAGEHLVHDRLRDGFHAFPVPGGKIEDAGITRAAANRSLSEERPERCARIARCLHYPGRCASPSVGRAVRRYLRGCLRSPIGHGWRVSPKTHHRWRQE